MKMGKVTEKGRGKRREGKKSEGNQKSEIIKLDKIKARAKYICKGHTLNINS